MAIRFHDNESFVSLFHLENPSEKMPEVFSGPRLGASQVHWPIWVGLKFEIMRKHSESWWTSKNQQKVELIVEVAYHSVSFWIHSYYCICPLFVSADVLPQFQRHFFLRCLIFDDSFEHEVKYWPRSESSLFLVDCQLLHVDMSYHI